MKIFLDSADINEIKELCKTNLIDGITTNPSLIAKSGGNILDVIKEICGLVSGPVSAEVTATDHKAMMMEAEKLLNLAENVTIKVPLTSDGLLTCKELSKNKKECRIVMLTGYGNLPTAVEAVKVGAIDYIAKPVDADDVESALLASPESKAKPPENPMSADRVKWEHIHRVFELCNRNVSETARRLKMHRRTLQRILSKRSPR